MLSGRRQTSSRPKLANVFDISRIVERDTKQQSEYVWYGDYQDYRVVPVVQGSPATDNYMSDLWDSSARFNNAERSV